MKARVIILLSAIVAIALSVAAVGSYIKYEILRPLELDEDYNIMELPFLVLTDEGLQFAIEFAIQMEQFPTEGTTEATDPDWTMPRPTFPTQPPTTRPTETVGPTQPTGPDIDPTEPQPTEPKPTQPKPTDPPKPPDDVYTYPNYDFSQGAVGADWYENVLFIGESRTVGLRDYARSGNAEYFCAVGMSVFNILDKSCGDGKHFEKQTLESLLKSKQYQKIFINLGINECGYPASTILAAYKELLELVQDTQSDAVVILQGVITVTEKYAGSKDHFKPNNIHKLNQKIKGLADGQKVFFIDANPYFTDPKGFLYTDITGDGCHFTGKYYKEWAKWISFAVGQLGI